MSPETTIESRLLPIAKLLWPALEEMSGDELTNRMVDVVGFLYGAPIALVGLVWLVAVTDLALIRTQWPALLLLLGLVIFLRQLSFVFFIEIAPRSYAYAEDSLKEIASWSAALVFGPTALWLTVLGAVSDWVFQRQRPTSVARRWHRAQDLALETMKVTGGLIALALYQRLGGAFPPADLTMRSIAPAAFASLARVLLLQAFPLPFLAYLSQMLKERPMHYRLGRYVAIVMVLPWLIEPFALLAALLFVGMGLGGYLFFAAGVLLASLLARQLSRAALQSRQHARELEKLEQLGRTIIQTPVTHSTLSDVLGEHIPDMFPKFEIDIRLFPSRAIYRYPEDQPPVADPAWEWLRITSKARCFLPEETLPWGGRLADQALVLAPVFEPGSADPIGGVVLTQPMQAVWNAEEVASSLPAIQTLASQIGSALHGAQLYRMEQELLLAGQIQASFLPDELPEIPGWQVTAALEPARQTAGDFYDVIPLPNGRFGIVVADVADKGMGAALYMALARTLLRTYALEYHTRPDFAMKVTNRRILMDTDVTMFVSVLYGILDPRTGQLTYCNAGHNPPYILKPGGEGQVRALSKTGMVVGAMPGVSWEQRTVQLDRGDMLVLYTDGVTDAQNGAGAFFGQERLLEVLRIHVGQPAHEAKDGVLRAVREFTGEASQFDDITLVIAVCGLPH
jgi:predicted membrane protein